MASTIQASSAAVRRLLNRPWTTIALLLIALLLCFEFLAFTSYIDSTWQSISILPNRYSFDTSYESSWDGIEAVQNLFPAATYGSSDGIRNRMIAQLRMMTEYGLRSLTVNRTAKVILRLGDFNMEEWIEGQQRFIDHKCPVNECILTSDYESNRLTADALLITQVDSISVKKHLPKPQHQIWIVRHSESPLHNRIDPSVLRGGLVNWTFTYRSDSTAYVQYEPQFLPKSANVDSRYHFRGDSYYMRTPPPGASYSTINYAQGKSKKVAWFVSNCHGPNGRGAYAAELGRYISIDIYGGCGELKCTERSGCRTMLSKHYKFYLAFENSNCIEYVTEKAGFQALMSDVIPIVMGARPEDYKALLPPDSYINVDDFQSPKYLAEYLHILDKNDTLYNSYFRWKDSWIPVVRSFYCRMCFLLHYRDDVDYTNWYDDYTQWWNGACNARRSDYGPWQTWRPAGFWNAMNVSSVHKPPNP